MAAVGTGLVAGQRQALLHSQQEALQVPSTATSSNAALSQARDSPCAPNTAVLTSHNGFSKKAENSKSELHYNKSYTQEMHAGRVELLFWFCFGFPLENIVRVGFPVSIIHVKRAHITADCPAKHKKKKK